MPSGTDFLTELGELLDRAPEAYEHIRALPSLDAVRRAASAWPRDLLVLVLNEALMEQDEATSLRLLDCGVSATARGVEGEPMLLVACSAGLEPVVRVMVERGASAIECFEGDTPLTSAAAEGHARIVAYLLELGAGTDEEELLAALELAQEGGHRSVVEVLSNRAPAAALDGEALARGEAARDWAERHGVDHATFDRLSAAASSVEAMRRELDNGVSPDTCDGSLSLLSMAVTDGRTEVVRLLLERGATVNAPTDDGFTPLISAANLGHLEVLEVLLAAGADVGAYEFHARETAIHAAARAPRSSQALACVRCLLAAGARVDARDADDRTPAEVAADEGYREVAELLLTAEGVGDETRRAVLDRCEEGRREASEGIAAASELLGQLGQAFGSEDLTAQAARLKRRLEPDS